MIRPDDSTLGVLPTATRVEVRFSSVDDVRALVFSELSVLPDRQRAAVANKLTSKLRSGGWLGASIEQHYKAVDAARLIGRCPEFVVKECKAGRFGRVYRDDGGWLIPASGIQEWLERRIFGSSLTMEDAR